MADDRKKRAELPTVPKMKAPGDRKKRSELPTMPKMEAIEPQPIARSSRDAKAAPARRRLVEEIGDRVRRDPRRESE